MIKSAKTTKTKKKGGLFTNIGWIIYFVVIIYLVLSYAENIQTINYEQTKIESIKLQIQEEKTSCMELKRILSADDDDILRNIARTEYGYVYPDEIIYTDAK